jgi:glucans biosynthesis protein
MTKYTGAALRIIDYRPQASDVTPDRLSAGLGKLQKDNMTTLDRRKLMAGLGALAAGLSPAKSAHAQGAGQGEQQPDRRRFGFNEVAARAQRLASNPYDANPPQLPQVFDGMDWDKYRQIRFRPERSLLRGGGSKFSLQLFHLGYLFTKPVTIHVGREGIFTPIPYSTDLFEYGTLNLPRRLPIDLGFAGFRVHYPLNDPKENDELVSFLGSSYFRWLGRDQKYGLSARGLAINTGKLDNNEEFPFFKEFWVDSHDPKADYVTVYALLDSPSVTGAYQFDVRPGQHSSVDVTAKLFARRTIDRLGLAPLTSMFFVGENDRHMNDRNRYDEFRPELHDSDGLLMHTAGGEWVWRPLKNPLVQEVQLFEAKGIKGFGLMQRDRRFESYQDIELNYEQRPSYWIEPTSDWGDGVIELVELATKDETADNIVTAFVPKAPLEAGKDLTFSYRMRSLDAGLDLSRLGHAVGTFSAPARALGSTEAARALSRRLIVDFAGGEIDYFLQDPGLLQLETSAQGAAVARKFIVPNPAIRGMRIMLDVQFEKDKVGLVTAALRSGNRAISETWSYAWRFYDF